MPESTPADPQIITADSITNDGTIAGVGTGGMVLWHSNTQTWELVPKQLDDGPAFISPDGSSIVTTDASQWPDPTNVLTWSPLDDWQVLAGRMVAQSIASNVSRNFRFVAGGGNNNGEAEQAWVWALDGGVQQMLPNPDWSGGATAAAVSDDGNVVIGNAVRAPQPGQIWPDVLPVRWVDGGPPTMLLAPDGRELSGAVACNADCSTVFGATGWFLKDSGEFEFLGFMDPIPDANPDPYAAYTIYDASADGSMIVGLYLANMYPTNPDSESYVDRPFIWTRATGLTSLRSVGSGDEDWSFFTRISFSPDGRRILLSGEHQTGQSRVVVLHLIPKLVRPTSGHSTHATPTPLQANRNGLLRATSKTVVD